MDSYRVEAQATMSIALPDADAEIGPVPLVGGGRKPEPELDLLSNILKTFNEMFGNIDWKDADKIGKVIAEELPTKVAADKAYQNAMKNSDKQNARIEHDKALERAVIELLSDHTELFKQFSDNPSFKKWLSETIFAATYADKAAQIVLPAPTKEVTPFKIHVPQAALDDVKKRLANNRWPTKETQPCRGRRPTCPSNARLK